MIRELDLDYIDRYGAAHHKSVSMVTRYRKGVWLVLISNESVLCLYPHYARDIPELPGGGVDDGETLSEAVMRELYEETELKLTSLNIENEYHQDVRFYAEHDDEGWDYSQTFYHVTNNIDSLYFAGKREVSEGLIEWIPLSELSNSSIHYMHQKALMHFDLM